MPDRCAAGAAPPATLGALAEDDIRIAPAELHAKVEAIFAALGSDARERHLIATHLVGANLRGHDSHGISLIPLYVRMVREGKVPANQRIRVTLDAGALLTLDGGSGFGQAIAHEAMELGIARARETGAVVLTLANSHHIGRIGHWAEQCADAGLASIHFVNVIGGPPVVAPFAGADARLHTNPFCVGIPRPGTHIILDFATSRAAQGKMRIALNRGQPVPPGYLIDAQGRDTNDPAVVYRNPLGALLPFGEHKGSGLGLVCDLLAGALSGGGTIHAETTEGDVYLNNLFAVILDPARLNPGWSDEAAAGLAFFQASPPRDPAQPVLVPGEKERRTAAERAHGIPVDRVTWSLVAEAAATAGVRFNRGAE